MMPQSARISTTACPKQAVPLGDSQREYDSHSLRLSTKLQVYRAVVVPTVLYGAESWVLSQKQIRLLKRFYRRCLRSILGIIWQDHVSNEEILKRASLPSIESTLLQVQLRWAGHVTKMEDVCMPKAVFFSELQEGKPDRGAPRKRNKGHMKNRRESAISHGSRRPQIETAGAHQ